MRIITHSKWCGYENTRTDVFEGKLSVGTCNRDLTKPHYATLESSNFRIQCKLQLNIPADYRQERRSRGAM